MNKKRKFRRNLFINTKDHQMSVVPLPARTELISQYESTFEKKINLEKIDMIILDFDDTIVPEGFNYEDDSIKHQKCIKLNNFFKNLIAMGKIICICTGAGNAKKFAQFCDNSIIKYYDNELKDQLTKIVAVFDPWNLHFLPKLEMDYQEEYEDCPMIAPGHSSKNENIGKIIRLYDIKSDIDGKYSNILFIDDQISLICNAKKAFNCQIIPGKAFDKDDIVDLFEELKVGGDIYKHKYLKYKGKYLKLKNN